MEFDKFLAETDWDFDSTVHGDDQVSVFKLNNYLFIILCDGVTTCTSGRLASVLIPYYVRQHLEEEIKEKGNTKMSIEDLLLESTKWASEKLGMIQEGLKREIIRSACRARLSKGPDTLLQIAESFEDMHTDVIRFSGIQSGLDVKVNELGAKVDKILQPLSKLTETTNIISVNDSLKSLDELESLLLDYYSLIGSLAEKMGRFRGHVERLTVERSECEKFARIIEEIMEPQKDEYLSQVLRSIKKFIEQSEKLLDISVEIENVMEGKTLSDKIPKNLKIMREEIMRLRSDTKISNREHSGTLEGIGDIFNEYVNKSREKKEDVLSNIKKRIYSVNSIQDIENMSFETTLALVAFEEFESYLKLTSVCLGDTEIHIIPDLGDGLLPHYRPPRDKELQSFISSKRGIEGHEEVQSRRLIGSETVVISSDGANIYYTTPGGYSGTVFLRLLGDWTSRHNSSVKDYCKFWIEYLRKNGALSDDASMIMTTIKRKEIRGKA